MRNLIMILLLATSFNSFACKSEKDRAADLVSTTLDSMISSANATTLILAIDFALQDKDGQTCSVLRSRLNAVEKTLNDLR